MLKGKARGDEKDGRWKAEKQEGIFESSARKQVLPFVGSGSAGMLVRPVK
jgi:hypothetical protein